jgi:hypothetical protein
MTVHVAFVDDRTLPVIARVLGPARGYRLRPQTAKCVPRLQTCP